MQGALLRDRGDGDAGGRDSLVRRDDGGIRSGLRGDQGLFDGLGSDERLVGGALPCLGLRERGLGFGDLLFSLLLAGEIAEGEHGAERAGFAVGLLRRGEIHAGLLGGVGGLDGGESEHLRFRSRIGDDGLRLGGGGLRSVSDLLQFVDLGGGLGEARTERGRVFLAVSRGGGSGDRDDRVAILTQAHNGFGLSVDELLLGLNLTECLGFAQT